MQFLSNVQPQSVGKKRRHIYQTFREVILSGELPPGSRLPPTYTLCHTFGVSHMTVHTALEDLVRDGLLVRHKGKGTFTADAKAERKRPHTAELVLVLPVQEDIDASGQTDNVMQMVHGCCAGSSASGSNLSIIRIPSYPGPQHVQRTVTKVMIYDGALFLGGQYSDLMAELQRRNFPCVSVCGEGAPISSAEYDLPASVRTAVDHLVRHGFRRFGYFGWTEGRWVMRYDAFRKHAAQRGVTVDPSWCCHCPEESDAQSFAGRYLSARTFPEVVLVDTHLKALTFLMVAHERGVRIPEQLKVLGFGSDTAACARMRLSMIQIPYEDMGKEGTVLLDRIIRGAVVSPVEKLLSARLIVRQSCGCAAKESSSQGQSPLVQVNQSKQERKPI